MIPGEILPASDPIQINEGSPISVMTVTNTSPLPVHLTAHFHLFEANPRLCFDRRRAFGMRLATHAKGSIRFEPGDTKAVEMVPVAGGRIIRGFHGVINGSLDEVDMESSVARLVERGFLHSPEEV